MTYTQPRGVERDAPDGGAVSIGEAAQAGKLSILTIINYPTIEREYTLCPSYTMIGNQDILDRTMAERKGMK